MFHTIEEAIRDLKQGKVIIVVDDENRENEGDFVALAEYATPDVISADQPPSVRSHKVDYIGCCVFRQRNEIAFVFPVLVIDYDDDFSLLQIANRHRSFA